MNNLTFVCRFCGRVETTARYATPGAHFCQEASALNGHPTYVYSSEIGKKPKADQESNDPAERTDH